MNRFKLCLLVQKIWYFVPATLAQVGNQTLKQLQKVMLICWWYTHTLPYTIGVAWAGVFTKDRCFQLTLEAILQKIMTVKARFFLFFFCYTVFVYLPPPPPPPGATVTAEKSVNTSASRRNPPRRERGKCRYIRCQGPTAEKSMWPHTDMGVFLRRVHSSFIACYVGRVRHTQTHFPCSVFLHNHPYKTKTVRAILLSTLTACRGCISESNVEFSASGT